MGLTVSTNMSSINAQNSLNKSQRNMESSFAQLASGSRINKAADDAAGLSISERFNSQIRSAGQARRNTMDGMSMIQVAEGGLNEVGNILSRFRELAVQSSSDTIGDTERGFINKEVQQLKNELQRISETTRFGAVNLLDGTGGIFDFQVDINNDSFRDRISYDAGEGSATLAALGIDGLDYSTKEASQEALQLVDNAQIETNGFRATLGAIQNRLQSTSDNLGVQVENLSAARSRVRDADVAHASAELTRNNVLLQASTAVLAQANQMPAQALKLVG